MGFVLIVARILGPPTYQHVEAGCAWEVSNFCHLFPRFVFHFGSGAAMSFAKCFVATREKALCAVYGKLKGCEFIFGPAKLFGETVQ